MPQSQLDRIEAKLDRQDERQDAMDITLVRQQGLLDDHVRRSLALETSLDVLKKEQEAFRAFLKERALFWTFVGRVVTGVSAGAGALMTIWKVLHEFGLLK